MTSDKAYARLAVALIKARAELGAAQRELGELRLVLEQQERNFAKAMAGMRLKHLILEVERHDARQWARAWRSCATERARRFHMRVRREVR